MSATVSPNAAPDRPGPVLRAIPDATVARLAGYLRVLSGIEAGTGRPARTRGAGSAGTTTDTASTDGTETTISSEELAALAGVNPAKLRKDLSHLGSHGTRGVGYDVATLLAALERTLGAHEVYPVALVGVGHLGSALAGYAGFPRRGFPIRVLLEADPAKIGSTVGGVTVSDIADADSVCRAAAVTIGVIATPESAAQSVADALVGAGVRSILNFAPGRLVLPDDVEVRRMDLALELQMLAFHESRRGRSPAHLEAL